MKNKNNESGYIIVGILVLMAVATMITASMMNSSSSSSSTRYVIKKDAENFYDVESSINKVTAWLQQNSKNMATAFQSSNFTNNFTIGDPSSGTNQGTAFVVPTMVKMKNTTSSVQLTNNSFFGTSAFPSTSNIDSGTSFDPVSAFQSTDFGNGVNIRVIMIWALETDGNFQPIFRIDAVTGSDPERGVHGINFVKSSLVTGSGATGYYSEIGDFSTQSPNNACYSYQYTWNSATSTWSRGAARSNCRITSRDDIVLRSAIYGNVATLKENGIALNGGSVSGSMCSGISCDVSYLLPNEPNYNTRCASVPAVNVTASGNPTNLSHSGTLASQCINSITIGSNKAIRFTTPDVPYYIGSLIPQNNSNSRILFDTIPPGKKYILYIDNFANGVINGNQLVATNLAPRQLEIYLTTGASFRMNGTAAMHAVITGPQSMTFNLLGNFSFFGAIRGGTVSVTGNAVLGYDEELGGSPVLKDINYTLYKASQRYR